MSVKLSFENVTQYFLTRTGPVQAVRDVTLSVPAGQFVALVGPSGCGKTTLLNMCAGLLTPTRGSVRIGDKPVSQPTPGISYMLARDALLPWRNARRNVEFSLEQRGMRRAERKETALTWLRRVGLQGFEAAHMEELSQGMRQRVALARTLAPSPDCLLMDEPFAAGDAQTRVLLQREFLDLWESTGATSLLVTHDVEEAILLSDRVIVFSPRPASIVDDILLSFPRPRLLSELRFVEEFRTMYHRVMASLHLPAV